MRPRRFRRVMFGPNVDYFKPRGIALVDLQAVNLNVEELEAIRLKDFENMDQIKAAKKMNVSQPTFHRILLEARKKVADALVSGKAIKIQGGIYKMPGGDGTGPLGQGPMTGRGQGMGQGQGAGRGAGMGRGAGQGRGMGGGARMSRGYGGPMQCKCPKCGETVPHVRGQPCVERKCPKCGTMMIRGDLE